MNSIIETPTVTGQVTFTHFDADGNIISESTVPNLVVTTGLQHIASRIKDATATAMTHMALGSSNATVLLADTTLGTQLGSRKTLTSTTVSGNTVTYVATFIAGEATGAVVEAGIFNASTSGVMLCRTVFPVINKNSGDSLAVTWVVTVS